MGNNITRAKFLRNAISFAADYAVKVVDNHIDALTPDRPRPPWSLNETEFLGTCEKCKSCGEICPRGVIYYYAEGSYFAAGTPYLDFKDDYCDYCGECVNACPSGTLNFERGEKELGKAVVNKNKCVSYSGTICSYCEESCPESALIVEPFKYPELDLNKCNGCGACVSPCIGDAIDIKKLN